MRLERVALVLLDMHIGSATPNSEMGDIRLALIESLKGSGVRKGGSGKAIPDMDHGGKAMTPEGGRKTRLS